MSKSMSREPTVAELRSECALLADVLRDAYEVIKTVDGDDSDECERLDDLKRSIAYALAAYDKPSDAQQFGMDLYSGCKP